jgi:hypothetical protein
LLLVLPLIDVERLPLLLIALLEKLLLPWLPPLATGGGAARRRWRGVDE